MELGPILESEAVVKIIHGGQNDVLYMQRDFGIFPIAVMDTQFVYNFVEGITDNGYQIKFREMAKILLKSVFPADLVEACQMGDWRIFPLPPDMRRYARYDSSLLIQCWEIVKEQLKDISWRGSELNPLVRSSKLTASLYSLKDYNTATQIMAKLEVPEADKKAFQHTCD